MLRVSCVCTFPSLAQRPTTCRYCSSLRVRCMPLHSPSRQTHHPWECTQQRGNHTTQHTPHEHHTHKFSAVYIQNCKSTRSVGFLLISLFFLFSACCVADLTRGWHVDPSLLCASSALVCMSIHLVLLLPSSFEWSGVNCAVDCREKSQEAPSQTGVFRALLFFYNQWRFTCHFRISSTHAHCTQIQLCTHLSVCAR